MTMMTATITETAMASTTATSMFGSAPTAQQRIAATMQKALLHKGKGTGPPGGGGPGQPRGGGQPAAAQQPMQVAVDVKAMGSLPQIFNGDRSKADDFIEEVKGYFQLNTDIAGYNSPYKKVASTLMLIKGDEPTQWV